MLLVSGDAVTTSSIFRIDIPVLKIEHAPPLFASYDAGMQRQPTSTRIGAWQSLHVHEFGWPVVWPLLMISQCSHIDLPGPHRDKNPASNRGGRALRTDVALCPDRSRRVAIHPRRLHSVLPSTSAAAIPSHASRDAQASTAQHRDVRQQPPVLIAHEQSTLGAARGPDPRRFRPTSTLPAIRGAGLGVSRAPLNSVTRLQS